MKVELLYRYNYDDEIVDEAVYEVEGARVWDVIADILFDSEFKAFVPEENREKCKSAILWTLPDDIDLDYYLGDEDFEKQILDYFRDEAEDCFRSRG